MAYDEWMPEFLVDSLVIATYKPKWGIAPGITHPQKWFQILLLTGLVHVQVSSLTTPTLAKPDPQDLHLVEDSEDEEDTGEERAWRRWRGNATWLPL